MAKTLPEFIKHKICFIDQRSEAQAIFLDILKTFYTINHDISLGDLQPKF